MQGNLEFLTIPYQRLPEIVQVPHFVTTGQRLVWQPTGVSIKFQDFAAFSSRSD